MSASVPSDRLGQPADAEPDEHHLANVRIGVRLLSSGVVFLFMAFTFAFWYLRELNSNHDFHPANVNPPQGYGIAILVCVIATAIVFRRARSELAADHEQFWRPTAIAGLALGCVTFVLQIVEYLELPFKTASGGFASVFWGWTVVFIAVWLAALYWMETMVAETLRRVSTDGPAVPVEAADACLVFLYTLAGIEIVGYIFLYLVK